MFIMRIYLIFGLKHVQFNNRTFLTYKLEGSKPPIQEFGPLVKVPFCLKMSKNHAEIAGNQV
jgi:hypothetical protein